VERIFSKRRKDDCDKKMKKNPFLPEVDEVKAGLLTFGSFLPERLPSGKVPQVA
jgi:hypothetical protein